MLKFVTCLQNNKGNKLSNSPQEGSNEETVDLGGLRTSRENKDVLEVRGTKPSEMLRADFFLFFFIMH